MSTMTSDLPVYREPVSQTTHRPKAVPERVGFWRGLWNSIKSSAIFVATARAVDGVIGWFTSGEATHTVRRAGSWIADKASSFWNWSTGLWRRTPTPVTETAAAPFRWLSWAGLWTLAGITAGLALVVSGFNWVADRWNKRGTANTVAAPVAERDPMVVPRTAATPAPEDAEFTSITVRGQRIGLPPMDAELGDFSKAYNWKRYFQVDNAQELADLVYGNDAQVQKLLDRMDQIEQDNDRLDALRALHMFTLTVDYNAPHNHMFLSNWFGRLDCYSMFVDMGAVRFFSTDEDDLDGGKVQSLQEKADDLAARYLAQRKNKNPKYTWFHKPGYVKGFLAQGKELEAKHVVAGHAA